MPSTRSIHPMLAIASAATALLVLAGCASATPKQASGTTATTQLVGGITRPNAGVDPLNDFTKGSVYLRTTVLSTLIKIDPKGHLRPDQATSWSSNADASVWTIHLRDSHYLDGTAFDANLVVASLDAALDPQAPAAGATSLVGLLSRGHSRAVDAHTVQFTLDTPYSNFPYALAGIVLNWLPAAEKTTGYAQGKIGGTGEYLVKSYSPDSGVVLVKNPKYWDAADIHVDRLQLKFYDDDQAIALALQAGEIDFAPNVPSTSAPVLKKAQGITVLSTPSSAHDAIRFNTSVAPFTDVRVRQAIADAIDRRAIVTTLFDGDAAVGDDNVFAPNFSDGAAVSQAVPQKKRDVAAAKKLLVAAGHPSGLAVELTIPDVADVTALAQLVKSQLAAAGITVTIHSLAEADYYGDLDDPNAPWLSAPFAITPWASRTEPSALLRAAYVTGATFNESHFSDPQLDALVVQYDKAADADARKSLAVRIATIESTQVPAIIPYFAPGYRAVSSSVKDFPTGPVASTLDLTGVRVTH